MREVKDDNAIMHAGGGGGERDTVVKNIMYRIPKNSYAVIISQIILK
jgi:hypothetical protein